MVAEYPRLGVNLPVRFEMLLGKSGNRPDRGNWPTAPAGRSTTFLFGPAKPLQVEAVFGVELEALLFQQALLEGIAAIAGKGVGNLALRIDNTMPRNIGCRVEVLEYAADKPGAPWQSGHSSNLAIGGHPALGNAANYGANRGGGFVTLGWGSVEQFALRRHRRLSSVCVVVSLLSRLTWPRGLHPERSPDRAFPPNLGEG